jgi:hypothetical protein
MPGPTTKQWLEQHERAIARHDREIAAIRKLITAGMRMIARIEKAQDRTERNLQALIDSLRRGNDGNSRRRIDIQ